MVIQFLLSCGTSSQESSTFSLYLLLLLSFLNKKLLVSTQAHYHVIYTIWYNILSAIRGSLFGNTSFLKKKIKSEPNLEMSPYFLPTQLTPIKHSMEIHSKLHILCVILLMSVSSLTAEPVSLCVLKSAYKFMHTVCFLRTQNNTDLSF